MKNYFRNNIFLLLMFFSAAFTLKAGVWSFSTGKGVHLMSFYLQNAPENAIKLHYEGDEYQIETLGFMVHRKGVKVTLESLTSFNEKGVITPVETLFSFIPEKGKVYTFNSMIGTIPNFRLTLEYKGKNIKYDLAEGIGRVLVGEGDDIYPEEVDVVEFYSGDKGILLSY